MKSSDAIEIENSEHLDRVIRQAQKENWTHLSLQDGADIDDLASRVATLTNLTSLDLRENNIGDEGVQALATLTGLTSLILWNNNIGDEGAQALASCAHPATTIPGQKIASRTCLKKL